MRHLGIGLLMYGGLIAHVALRGLVPPVWLPNLLLLAAAMACCTGVRRGQATGVVWAAVAGLLCDALTGRPLGVTMLAATLVATLAARLRVPATCSPLRQAGTVLVFVAVVEMAARSLSYPTPLGMNHGANIAAALAVATVTAIVSLTASLVAQATRLLVYVLVAAPTARPR